MKESAKVCGGIKAPKMTKFERITRLRELARKSNISERYKNLINTRPASQTLHVFKGCETVEDVERKCREIEEVVERNREILERLGLYDEG